MNKKKSFFIGIIFIVPLVLGISIVGYWYWTTRVDKQVMLPIFGEVPPFSLTAEDSSTTTNQKFIGKVSIIDCIFTQCAGACPMMSGKMSELQQTFHNDSRIQFISISVDPENDTPPVLTQYAAQYGAVKGKWTFLTGSKMTIFKLITDGFHLETASDTNGISHSQKFVVVDQRGAIRGYYDSEDADAMKILVRDAEALSSKIAS